MSTVVEHPNRRLLISLPGGYDDARIRYETLVPAVDFAAFATASKWEDVVAEIKRQAPHGFLRYFSSDVAPAMRGSASVWPCSEYLVGNHTIAERMYRHDPGVMLHAPLRTLIYDAGQGTVLAVDQPSLLFASYGRPEITAVGVELDGLLAVLVELLGAEVPAALR
ncbi:DUF302 domain-containing protein [Mycolicibacterium setense]|uniref:DUF302 domain-containing protein n=1 Tax=Mycolicibacterium setense TaxID=431269 RepID=A0ABR4YTM8_9MYCO|nr:DUF302 domain-containing protein [Mycolicibacterium setense]KHO19130.1 hypothetical protein QQ25_20365 [Mycolicibacterium setense]KHO23812.1 hypothetical protein QQ44_16615 [Mycolicibacterium setense]MCV7113029.1 DUF302 domain-containing protein [Mycolicibacterium setense]OBB13481.1 hypothetical protein A5761_19930 [Mycolicibacterium setense]